MPLWPVYTGAPDPHDGITRLPRPRPGATSTATPCSTPG